MNPKNLSPSQKKWVLTGTLVAALGFSLSAPISHNGGSFHFASTTTRSESTEEARANRAALDAKKDPNVEKDEKKSVTYSVVTNEGKVVRVKYVDDGDHVRAIPVQGGLNCELANGNCDAERVLDVPFDSTQQQLEVALRKVLAGEAKTTDTADVPRKRVVRDRERDDEDVVEEKEWSSKLMRVKRICEGDSRRSRDDDEDNRRSSASEETTRKCVNAYLQALRTNRGSKTNQRISKAEAADFFRVEIRPLLVGMISADPVRFSQFSINVLHSEDGLRGSDLIRRLQSGLPGGYDEVRREVANLAREVVAHDVAQIKQQKLQAQAAAAQAKEGSNRAAQIEQEVKQNPNMSIAERAQKMGEANSLRQQAIQLGVNAQSMEWQAQTSLSSLQNYISPALYNQEALGLNDAFSSGLVTQNFLDSILKDLGSSTQSILGDKSLTSITTDLSLNPASKVNGPQFTQDPKTGKQVLMVPQSNGQGNDYGGAIRMNPAQARGATPAVPFGPSGGGNGGAIQMRQFNPGLRTY